MVRVQLYTYSTCTVNVRVVYNYSIFADRYFRTLKYFRTKVLSYFRTTLYEGTSVVRKYFRIIRKYFRTFVLSYESTTTTTVRVHVRCLIKVVGPNGLTVHVHVYVYSKCCEGSSYFITTIITRVRVVYVYNVQLYESTFVHVYFRTLYLRTFRKYLRRYESTFEGTHFCM